MSTNETEPTPSGTTQMTWEQIIANMAQGGGQSGADYLSGYAYPSRVVRGVAEGLAVNATDLRTLRGGGGTKQSYTGSALVDSNGMIVRQQYDMSPSTDANTILMGLARNPVDLKTKINLLKTRGYYGSSKPSALGTDNTDRSAMAEFLNFANSQGVTYDVAFKMLEAMPQVQATGTKAPSIRVTSQDDLKVVFRKASTDLLGYEVDEATALKFATAYNQLEISEGRKQAAGGVYEAAASPSTIAEQQILKQFKPEAESFAAGNYAQIMDDAIKALGA